MRIRHAIFLNFAHLVDDPFEDAFNGIVRHRSGIIFGDVPVHLIFALRFVDGHVRFLLDTADFLHNGSALAEQLENAEVYLVYPVTALRKSGFEIA
jgi:hypothetical protein